MRQYGNVEPRPPRFTADTIWHGAGIAFAAAFAYFSFTVQPPNMAEAKESQNFFETTAHALTSGQCQAILKRLDEQRARDGSLLWVWTEESVGDSFAPGRHAMPIGSVSKPRPYALAAQDPLPTAACGFASNTVGAVSTSHAVSIIMTAAMEAGLSANPPLTVPGLTPPTASGHDTPPPQTSAGRPVP